MAHIEKRESEDGKSVTYRVQVKLKGHPVQNATFERVTDAKRWAVQTKAAIREGRYFKTAEAKKHTVSDLIDLYLETRVPHKQSDHKQQRQQLDWWRGQIGAYAIADVTPALVVQGRDTLAATPLATGGKRSPSMVNRYRAIMIHALTIAVKEWQWTEDNPFLKISKLKQSRGRVRFLSDDGRDRLFAACMQSKPCLNEGSSFQLPDGEEQSADRTQLRGLSAKDRELRGLPTMSDQV